MLVVPLDVRARERLDAAALVAGCSAEDLAREAIFSLLDEVEDVEIAMNRLKSLETPVSLEEVERELGLA